MMLIIGCVSQKGGVGKSTLARLLATEFTSNGWSTKIADMDVSQATSLNWGALRMANNVEPNIAVEPHKTVAEALRTSEGLYEVLIFDGKPAADAQTIDIAKKSRLTVLPTGASFDDLKPTAALGRELVKQHVDPKRIITVLTGIMSPAEERDARDYLADHGFAVAKEMIPRMTSYAQALNQGLSPAEVPFFDALRNRAKSLATAIALQITEKS